jgi:predicted nucleic acid-binding protein
MNVVLDVSSAVELVLARPRASAVAGALAEAEAVAVPDLFVSEATNVFWKLHGRGGLEPERCGRALRRALALPDVLVPCSELTEEVFALACARSRPAYDLFYLVLARRRAALLLTEDRRLGELAAALGVRTLPGA